jgi:hypothetical protein
MWISIPVASALYNSSSVESSLRLWLQNRMFAQVMLSKPWNEISKKNDRINISKICWLTLCFQNGSGYAYGHTQRDLNHKQAEQDPCPCNFAATTEPSKNHLEAQ